MKSRTARRQDIVWFEADDIMEEAAELVHLTLNLDIWP
jgi:hypothetical protein